MQPSAQRAWSLSMPITQLDKLQGIVTGIAAYSSDSQGRPVIDHDGHYIPIGELERGAHAAFASTIGRVGDMHEVAGMGDIVESMVLSKEKRQALGLGPGPECWAMSLRVRDPKLLSEIADGSKTELSINGSAMRIKGTPVLTDLRFDKAEVVSIVDHGASGNSELAPRILLLKRKEPYPMAKTVEEIMATLSPEDHAVLMEHMAAMKAGTAAPHHGTPPEKIPEDVKKRLDAAKEEVEILKRQNADLATGLKKVEDARKLEHFQKRAAGLKHIPGMSTDELGGVLKACSEGLDPATFAKLEGTLSAVEVALEKSVLLKETGSGGGGAGSDEDALNTIAKEIATKEQVTIQKARILASERRPDLYASVRASQLAEGHRN